MDETFRKAYAETLKQTYFSNFPDPYKGTEAFKRDLDDHVYLRCEHFSNHVLPWLNRHVVLKNSLILEVGSGTGSSTAALAPFVGQIICYEIDKMSVKAARERARLLNQKNVLIRQTLLLETELNTLSSVDGIFLAAVLEHCTFQECQDILKLSWQAIKPGGWVCIVDTPNRLSPIDHHTSQLPFFSSLPAEMRIAYSSHSPRQQFVEDFKLLTSESPLLLTRWGSGISYHEFELALGDDVHRHIIADGWEPEIVSAIGIMPEDQSIELQVKAFAPYVHRAFCRRDFYLIIQKPAYKSP